MSEAYFVPRNVCSFAKYNNFHKMAFHQQHYQPPSQNSGFSLASSHSSLDGVPFKISASFCPPHQPDLPAELLNPSHICEALHDEYEYDTEEAVLAWSRAREEAKAQALTNRQATLRARAALAAAESSSSSDSDEAVPDTAESRAASETSVSVGGVVQQPPQKAVKPPWQLSVGTQGGNSILTPVQAAQAKVATPKTPKAEVDLALFEQEGDPFDNLELQTINDMEELRTLLGGTNMGDDGNGSSHVLDTHSEDRGMSWDAEHVYSNMGVCSSAADSQNYEASSASDLYANILPGPSGMMITDSQQTVSVCSSAGGGMSVDANCNANSVISKCGTGFVIEPTGDGDYVQIRPDYGQQTVSYQRDCDVPIYSNVGLGAESCLGGDLPSKYAESKVLQPVLPPIRQRGQSLGSDKLCESAAVGATHSSCSAAITSLPQTNGDFASSNGRMTQSMYFPSASAAGTSDTSRSDFATTTTNHNHTYSNLPAVAPKYAINLYSRYSNAGGSASPPSTDGGSSILRSTKSSPDLSVSGRAINSSTEPWNPYKPLPPTPVSGQRSSSSSSESLPNDHQCSYSPPASRPPPARASQGMLSTQSELDPYNSLSSEAKVFVNNLTAMGFSRSRAARAVQKFGADEKEVLDHLFNVDKLVEKKYTAAQAETGLQLFKNDVQKAEQFLDLYQQFTELGFTGERIQTALVKHQLDRDQALDYLTK